jgi:Flp pilus assembly pilin Flp
LVTKVGLPNRQTPRSRALLRDDDGATAMEYGILAAAIAGVLIIVAFFFGNRLGNQLNNVSAHIN